MKSNTNTKKELHSRNKHRDSYDFNLLTKAVPDLSAYVYTNSFGTTTIDFSNPKAVEALNKALLLCYYQIESWKIPQHYLCPPIPGRADYLHYLADLLAENNEHQLPIGNTYTILDVGTGANLIYPIIGTAEYHWSFIASEIDKIAFNAAQQNILQNPLLKNTVSLRLQNQSQHQFIGIIQPNDQLAATVCNPPFHSSLEEALLGTLRKNKNLSGNKNKTVKQNFGGQGTELWCKGGELHFIQNMIQESLLFQKQSMWFTSLVSKSSNLKSIEYALKQINAIDYRIISMGQGNKISRFVAWTFMTNEERNTYFKTKS